MKKLFLLGVAILMSFSVQAESFNLMVFGDSLSAGHKLKTKDSFGNQLEVALIQKGYPVRVTNYSVSGATTADGVRKLKSVLAKKPDVVILELGANDMLRHLNLAQSTKNLQTIISTFQENKIPVLLAGMEASVVLPTEYRTQFSQMYIDLSIKNKLPLYPFFMQGLWKEDGTHLKEEYFLPDQIHPSAEGVSVMVQNILPVVEQFLVGKVTRKKGR